MKSKVKAHVAMMAVMSVFLFGSAATAQGPHHGRCNQACNEVFNSRKASCRTLPKGERKACEASAREAHKNCLQSCK
jgi:hypothetical protein